MNQPEQPRGNLFDLFETPEERLLRAVAEGAPLPSEGEIAQALGSGVGSHGRLVSGFGSRGHGKTTALAEAIIERHEVTVRTGPGYVAPATRHLQTLDRAAPTSKAAKRFIAQQQAAYRRAEAREEQRTAALVQASLKAGLTRLEATIMRGQGGATIGAGDAVAEGGQGADREAAGPAGG